MINYLIRKISRYIIVLQYGKLLQETKQYLKTVGSKERIEGLLKKLKQLWKDLLTAVDSKFKSVLKEVVQIIFSTKIRTKE